MRTFTAQPFWSLILALCCILNPFCQAHANEAWHPIAPGIEYHKLEGNSLIPWSAIHVLRIDLRQTTLALRTAKNIGLQKASAREYVENTEAVAAINGGFFDNLYQPLGLRINQRHQLTPFKNISWWSVFYIHHHKAYIKSASTFHFRKDIDVAIQSGPRLLVNRRVPPNLKPGHAERSAVGITQDGRLILVVTERNLLTTTELAHIMRSPPLNCHQAINLDGGSSSQLYIKTADFSLNVPGFSPVSDAIVIHPQIPNGNVNNIPGHHPLASPLFYALMLKSGEGISV